MEGNNETLIQPNQIESNTNQNNNFKKSSGRGGYYKKVRSNKFYFFRIIIKIMQITIRE